jgi:hypothetical protein
VPMAPAIAASAMYRMDKRKIAVHVRVCEFGSRLDSAVAMAAERQPVTIISRISAGVAWFRMSWGVGCVLLGAASRVVIGGGSVNAEDDCSRVITRCSVGQAVLSDASFLFEAVSTLAARRLLRCWHKIVCYIGRICRLYLMREGWQWVRSCDFSGMRREGAG